MVLLPHKLFVGKAPISFPIAKYSTIHDTIFPMLNESPHKNAKKEQDMLLHNLPPKNI